MAYTLPDLPYAYDALEPNFDARTMERQPVQASSASSLHLLWLLLACVIVKLLSML